VNRPRPFVRTRDINQSLTHEHIQGEDTLMKLRTPRPAMPLALMTLAVSIGLLAYNLGPSQAASAASSASSVNIADPTTPTNVAHVSSAGALSTSVSGPVTNVPGTPATPLNLSVDGTSVDFGGELVQPTAAEIDLTSLTVTVPDFVPGASPVRVFFSFIEAPSGTKAGDCAADGTSDTEIQVFDLQPGSTDTVSPASPIVMAPPAGHDECVFFGTAVDGGGSDHTQVDVAATGFGWRPSTGVKVSGRRVLRRATNSRRRPHARDTTSITHRAAPRGD
jgi:hypothetical protein